MCRSFLTPLEGTSGTFLDVGRRDNLCQRVLSKDRHTIKDTFEPHSIRLIFFDALKMHLQDISSRDALGRSSVLRCGKIKSL